MLNNPKMNQEVSTEQALTHSVACLDSKQDRVLDQKVGRKVRVKARDLAQLHSGLPSLAKTWSPVPHHARQTVNVASIPACQQTLAQSISRCSAITESEQHRRGDFQAGLQVPKADQRHEFG